MPHRAGGRTQERERPHFLSSTASFLWDVAAASLADGLPVAVSLALAAGAAVVAVAGRLLCAAGGGALARTVSGAAGQTAVLQRGAGLSSLQRPFLQEHGFKHRQVIVAAALLRPQEHAVRLVARFLKDRDI